MRYVFYNHGGSASHGCEALMKTTANLLSPAQCLVLSDHPEEDTHYGVSPEILLQNSKAEPKRTDWIRAYLRLKLRNDYSLMDAIPYFPPLDVIHPDDTAISIGGDIYCYGQQKMYMAIDRRVRERAGRMTLLGCSIEPELLQNAAFVEDMAQFDLISAREHITYNALVQTGLRNVQYCPDLAFSLQPQETELPREFQPGNTVGLNISPMVLKKAGNRQRIMDNCRVLIDDLMRNTDASVAFIPHVVWKDNDDRKPLGKLYREYKSTGRVCMVQDQTAAKLKYVISQCSFFIGARTHATIAAYSTGVPTLTIGYSVKSRGIARDLFGQEKGFVLPCQNLQSEKELMIAFQKLEDRKDQIHNVLISKEKEYLRRIASLKAQLFG